MHEWFTAGELAELALPALPGTESGIIRRAKRENWKARRREGQGGGHQYHISNLNRAQRGLVVSRISVTALTGKATAPETTEISLQKPSKKSQLTARQTSIMEARAAIVAEINQLALGIGRSRAIVEFIKLAKAGELRPDLQCLIPVANAKSGSCVKYAKGGRVASRATIYNWIKAYEKGGPEALAPELPRTPDMSLPEWAPHLMDLWANPAKPSLQAVVEGLNHELPNDIQAPSYDQARRFLKDKMSIVERMRGRMGPQELKALKAFTRRDTNDLWPGAIYSADGHTFKAKVQHPFHGQAFRPEITAVIDAYTRYVVGWSVGLAENSMGVLEALSSAMIERNDGRKHGLPAIWYTDNGAGFRANLFEDQATGFYARWGITPKASLPYNSQARGLIERLNRTLWTPLAKSLPTYTGSDQDKQYLRVIDKERRLAKRVGTKAAFEVTWEDFQAAVQDTIDAYNNTPHSSLPRVRDPQTKAWRHLTPYEVWDKWEVEGGSTVTIKPSEAADLTRPYERRKCARCEVQILGNLYFHPDLEAYHGKQVLVGYDIHDASKVWVRDTRDQRLIAVAELDGNRRPYFDAHTLRAAKSYQDKVLEERTKGRLRRIEEKRTEIIAEAQGEPLQVEYEHVQAMAHISLNTEPEPTKKYEAIHARAGERPMFPDDLEWAKWLAENPSQITDNDRTQLGTRMNERTFRQLLELEGIDPRHLLAIAA